MKALRLAYRALVVIASIACLAACGTYDPLDQFDLQKKFDPDYKKAYEANKNAPYIYDRTPTQAERDQVHAACVEYVRYQLTAQIGQQFSTAFAPRVNSNVVPPNADKCEMQHFNLQAHQSAVALHNTYPGTSVPPY